MSFYFPKNTSRRRFLQTAVAAGIYTNLPSRAFANRSGRINVACVGVGGIGEFDVEQMAGENIVAFCDVDERRASNIYKKYPKVPRFKDYRKMFDKLGNQIQAVTISTPDHMHYPIARAAMELNKHVFLQKPLAHTIWEARELTRLAKTSKVVTQMGNQGRSSDGIKKIYEAIRSGSIGKVSEVHIGTNRPMWPQGIERRPARLPNPPTLDWNLWLGIAPSREFNNDYLPFNWRGWWDFGGGSLGDMGCHLMDAAFCALDLSNVGSITARTSLVTSETAPKSSHLHYKFPSLGERPALSLFWHDGKAKKSKLPPALTEYANKHSSYQIFIGDKGSIAADEYCNNLIMNAESPAPRILTRQTWSHHQDWIRACKGEVKACSSFDSAGPLTELVLSGNLAIRSGKEVVWSANRSEILNNPQASALITKAYRPF